RQETNCSSKTHFINAASGPRGTRGARSRGSSRRCDPNGCSFAETELLGNADLKKLAERKAQRWRVARGRRARSFCHTIARVGGPQPSWTAFEISQPSCEFA